MERARPAPPSICPTSPRPSEIHRCKSVLKYDPLLSLSGVQPGPCNIQKIDAETGRWGVHPRHSRTPEGGQFDLPAQPLQPIDIMLHGSIFDREESPDGTSGIQATISLLPSRDGPDGHSDHSNGSIAVPGAGTENLCFSLPVLPSPLSLIGRSRNLSACLSSSIRMKISHRHREPGPGWRAGIAA